MKHLPGVPTHLLGTVLYYPARTYEPQHEKHIHCALGQQLARLMTMHYGGEHTADSQHHLPVYFVPSSTIIGLDLANSMGIQTEADLFGGVVPYAFVCTKAITHPLISPDASAPTGWSTTFSRQVAQSVLAGYTAFSLSDARQAGIELLKQGVLRVKPVHATAGRGQIQVNNLAELDAALALQDSEEIAHSGLVLEEHLNDVRTYSVGQVHIAGIRASYVGTQRLTPDNNGELVYGGSDLIVVRGDFDDLMAVDLSAEFHQAISQARVYDQAANDCFPGFFASRRNYDTAEGINSQGQHKAGVLEQSWRIGGASTAEIAALEQFWSDPELKTVSASTFEVFGSQDGELPPEAQECFQGVDPDIGQIRKYVMVKAYGYQ